MPSDFFRLARKNTGDGFVTLATFLFCFDEADTREPIYNARRRSRVSLAWKNSSPSGRRTPLVVTF